MTENVFNWMQSIVNQPSLKGKRVLEVGSYNVNGSIRPVFEPVGREGCSEYIGTDMLPGPGVDKIINAQGLVKEFGEESFDVVVSCDSIEHVEHWREVLCEMMKVLKTGGRFYFTTVFPGYPKHDYPNDHWRFTIEDVQQIFGDQLTYLQTKNEGRCIWWSGVKKSELHLDSLKEINLFNVL